MSFDINQYQYELAFDKPIAYKNLLIHPIKLKDYYVFFGCIGILTIEKNKIPDIKILSMSYLDFLYHQFTNCEYFSEFNNEDWSSEEEFILKKEENKKQYLTMFYYIISLTLSVEFNDIKIYKNENDRTELSICGVIYDKNDFEIIRKIICHQNMPDFSEDYIDPDLENEIKSAEKLNGGKKKDFTLESQIECLMLATSMDLKQVELLSVRKLIRILRLYDAKLHYEIYKTGEISGMVSFKKEIEHWFYTSSPNKIASALTGYDEYKNKLNKTNI